MEGEDIVEQIKAVIMLAHKMERYNILTPLDIIVLSTRLDRKFMGKPINFDQTPWDVFHSFMKEIT